MKIIIAIAFLIIQISLFSQTVVDTGKETIRLESSFEVELLRQKNCNECFYYLPTNLKVSVKNNEPEISLVEWEGEKGVAAGAILHFLIDWDISKVQMAQLEKQLEDRIESNAVVLGSVSLQPSINEKLFFGKENIVNILNSSLNTIPPIPTTPGAKMAFSFRFDENSVKELKSFIKTMRKSKAELILTYKYEIDGVDKLIDLKLPLKHIFMYL